MSRASKLSFPPVALSAVLACFVDRSQSLQLALLAFGLALLWWPTIGPRWRGFDRGQRDTALLAVAVVMLVLGVKDNLVKLLVDGQVRVSNVYHYYLGSKYAPELGYTDLYAATLAADSEGQGYWEGTIAEVRDLEDYVFVSREQIEARYRPELKFSPARWQSFKGDVEALSQHRRPERWRNVFRDRGYNGTPLWTFVGRALTALVPATSPALPLLALLDLVLLGFTAVLLVNTFGRTRSILVLLLFVASPTNVARLVGGFLQTDWLCAIVCSLCFYRRRWPGLAAATMAYAVMTRIFPLLFVVGACISPLRQAIQHRRTGKRFVRYLLSFAAFCVLGLAIGMANKKGTSDWFDFVEAINLHRDQHVLGERRIGLEHAFTGDFRDFPTEVSKAERAQSLEERQPLILASQVLLIGLLLSASAWRRSWDGQILGLVGIFALLVLSRYYYGVLALMPLMSTGEGFRRRIIAGGQIAAFFIYFLAVNQGAGWHSGYTLLNALLAVYFFGVLGPLAYSQLRGWRLEAGAVTRSTQKTCSRPHPVAVSVFSGGQRLEKTRDRPNVQTNKLVEVPKMNKKLNSRTLILAVAATLLAGGIAWAGSELRLETRLTGSRAVAGAMKGKAKFSNRLDRARRKFSVEIENGKSGHMFDVMISGVVVGTVMVNNLGVGELDYDDTANGNDSDQRFPRNFPELDGGEVVQAGPLTGALQLK